MEYYSYIKALHIIFIVTWFSGLFYVPRLFIYIIEAQKKEAIERNILTRQLNLMTKRLWWIITWPSAILTLIFGIWMFYFNVELIKASWFHIKLSFILLLFMYHLRIHNMYLHFQRGNIKYKSMFMRLWNEVATLLLFAIVFIAILKNTFSWVFGLLGIIALVLIIYIAIRVYRKNE